MRKIKNNSVLQKLVNDFYDTLFNERQANFARPVDRLAKLRRSAKAYPGITRVQRNAYIDMVSANLDSLMRATPLAIHSWIIVFEQAFPAFPMHKDFAEDIGKALCYEEMRTVEFPELFQKLQIKTCIYCHSQLTLVLDKEFYTTKRPGKQIGDVKKRIAKLELDHFKAKATYPFLSATFYNLYPVCANCNKAKSDNPGSFELYADAEPLDVYKFGLDSASVIAYWGSRDIKDIRISFTHVDNDLKSRRLYNAMFDISEIYETQLDIVEELIHKKQVYTKMYKKSLKDQFEDLFPDKALIKRLVIGNYDKPEDVHKRPMAKFIQDMATDLGLI